MEKFNPISLEQPPSRYAPENSFYENFEQLQKNFYGGIAAHGRKPFKTLLEKLFLRKSVTTVCFGTVQLINNLFYEVAVHRLS